ncbi:Spy/CpxP family protein refolding chaperone [uncultured Massilia sp.]|uniref:Spy/CpxP family protein refolding chaperone n=1 Tax=uncultured Massilia sp. TaxID=169973 RepID=UPI0025F63B5B|nr:Spy/CpxP family protein refolding chaperone [uncultured Massilia sp.]
MTTVRKHFATALAALSLGAAAIGAHAQTAASTTAAAPAQAGQHQGHRQHPKRTPEQRAELRAKRVAKLHDALKITPAQEQAWKSFVASMQPPARQPGQRPDRAAWAGLSAPERMAKAIEMQKRRTVAMEQRLGALNSFYSVLTPDQKKTFDDQAGRMQHRWHRGPGGWQRGADTARG